MYVQVGDYACMRDGRVIYVTDAPDYGDENGMVSTGPYPGSGLMPAESIFVGYSVHPELFEDPNLGEPGYEPRYVASDISEVKAVVDEFGDLVDRS